MMEFISELTLEQQFVFINEEINSIAEYYLCLNELLYLLKSIWFINLSAPMDKQYYFKLVYLFGTPGMFCERN